MAFCWLLGSWETSSPRPSAADGLTRPLLVIVLHLFFWWVVQRYIHFAGACIETSMSFLKRHPTTLLLGAASAVPVVAWTVLVVLCLYRVSQQLEGAPVPPRAIAPVRDGGLAGWS